MIRMIRLLFSAKAAVFLLTLMAVALVLGIPGDKSPSFLKMMMLTDGIASYPFLGLLLLLLLNQLGAMFIRLGWYLKKPNLGDDLPTPEPEPILMDDEEEWTPKPPPPPALPPSELAQFEGKIETIVPSDNARSLLRTLGFKIGESAQFLDDKEEIEAHMGGKRPLFTLLFHVGTVVLLSGLILGLAVYPTQELLALEGKTDQFGGAHKTPFHKLLKLAQLRSSETASYPTVTVKLKKTQLYHKEVRVIKYPSGHKARWEDSLNRLFLKPASLDIHRWNLPVLQEVSVDLEVGKYNRKYHLSQAQPTKIGPYDVSVGRPHVEAMVSLGGRDTKLVLGQPAALVAGGTLTLTGFIPSEGETGCLQVVYRKKGSKNWVGCIPHQVPYTIPGVALFQSNTLKLGAVLYYSNNLSNNLIILGLVLFVLGFLGFWLPQRYKLFITWNRDKNDITIEGSGYGIRAKSLLMGVRDSLYFPIENLTGPGPRKPSGPKSSGPQSPSGPQQRAQGSVPAGIPTPPPTRPAQQPNQGQPATTPQAKAPQAVDSFQAANLNNVPRGPHAVVQPHGSPVAKAGVPGSPQQAKPGPVGSIAAGQTGPQATQKASGIQTQTTPQAKPATQTDPRTQQTTQAVGAVPAAPKPASAPAAQAAPAAAQAARPQQTLPTGAPAHSAPAQGQPTRPASPQTPAAKAPAAQPQRTAPLQPPRAAQEAPKAAAAPASPGTQDRLTASPAKAPAPATKEPGPAQQAQDDDAAKLTVQTKSQWRQTDSFDKDAILSAAKSRPKGLAALDMGSPTPPGHNINQTSPQPIINRVKPESLLEPNKKAAPAPPAAPKPAAPPKPAPAAAPQRPAPRPVTASQPAPAAAPKPAAASKPAPMAPPTAAKQPASKPAASKPAAVKPATAPKPAAKADAGLDLDSLFAGIGGDSKSGDKGQGDPMFDNLDIDSLFSKVEDNIEEKTEVKPRPTVDDDIKTTITQRPDFKKK